MNNLKTLQLNVCTEKLTMAPNTSITVNFRPTIAATTTRTREIISAITATLLSAMVHSATIRVAITRLRSSWIGNSSIGKEFNSSTQPVSKIRGRVWVSD